MTRDFKAVLTYRMKKTNPDFEYATPKQKNGEVVKLEDTFYINIDAYESREWDELVAYMKNDLVTIANGGYSSSIDEFIEILDFKIERIR